MLFTATTLLVACDSQDLTVLDSTASTTVSLSASDVVLDVNNAGQDVLIVNWTEPNYGFSAGPNYQIILTYADSAPKIINVGNTLSKTFESVELNKILLGLGLNPGEASEVTVQVKAILSAASEIMSNSTTITATTYADKLDLSTPWTIIGDAVTGTKDDWSVDAPMYTTSTENVLVAYLHLSATDNGAALGFKFRKDLDWTVNLGGSTSALTQGGSNLSVDVTGDYKITLDLNNNTYTAELYTWGIVGDATPIGWPAGNPGDPGYIADQKMTYDSYSDTWKVVIALKDGAIKFRQNEGWDVNLGDTGADGSLEQGGADIAVTAGNYIVTLDLTNNEYTLDPIDHIWGIVGDATPIGWPNGNPGDPGYIADQKLTIDFSADNNTWIIKGITLSDGAIKFRADESWDVNYGDDGNDGTLEAGGADIPVTAGTYDIVLDFNDPNAPTYTLTLITG